ncbi:MAG TPA: hypothetical protein VGZ93_02455 [Candidatus Methylacidiphilales bacterium]|jgi:hypothetical protein|nr:hypothetical protein [Candidatus Methylacidiphilales bacterium]
MEIIPSKPGTNRVLRPILAGAVVLACLLALILVLQVHGLYRNYAYYITTGSESLPVYSIWEVQEGHPLYQWPYKDFYQLTLYNFGFYYSYAFVLGLFHIHGPEILLYGRLLTAFLSLVGVIVQTRLIKAALCRPVSGLEEAATWLISFCTWFNSYLPGYYDLSVRSDVLAVLLCAMATLFFLRYLRGEKGMWLLAAALVWILAWCVKQSSIFSLIGVGFYLLLFRKWKALSILVLLYGLATGSILLLGSPEYRWNILTAPRVDPWTLSTGLLLLLRGVAYSLFTWSALFTFPLLLKIESRAEPQGKLRNLIDRMRPGGDLSAIAVLACIVIAGGPAAALTLCRKGGSLNYMFEVFVMASSLSYILFLRLGSRCEAPAARRLGYLAGGLLLSMCVFPLAQIALQRIGPMERASRQDFIEKREFASFLISLPKPLLISDEIWNLPWFAGDNHGPLVKLDPIWYPDALDKGLIQDGGIDGLIRRHWYASIYVQKNSDLYQTALDSGYRPAAISDPYTRYKDSLGRPVADCALLLFPGRP